MESRAKTMEHPIHPILVSLPLGLLTTSVIFDVLHLFTGGSRWAEVSYWMIVTGVIGGLLAAVFGLTDWLAIPSGTRGYAREGDRVGAWTEQRGHGGAVRFELVAACQRAWGPGGIAHRPFFPGCESRFARGLPRGRVGLPDGHRGDRRGEPERFRLVLGTRLPGELDRNLGA
jgi:hypothetical protein